MKIKLAEALLRRKELQDKINLVGQIKKTDLIYQIQARRIPITAGLESLDAEFPKLELSQVTGEYDHYARALRLIDAVIQQANWTCELEVDDKALADYKSK